MEQMQGLHTLELLGEARQAYPTSPFGLPLVQPQITLLLASLAPSHAKALDMDSLHPRCLYLAQAGDHRGRGFPACKSHCLAISVSAQEQTDFSRGKTSARGLRSLPHAKLRAHFHSPTLNREVKLSLQGSLLPPLQLYHSPARRGEGACTAASDASPCKGNSHVRPCWSPCCDPSTRTTCLSLL